MASGPKVWFGSFGFLNGASRLILGMRADFRFFLGVPWGY